MILLGQALPYLSALDAFTHWTPASKASHPRASAKPPCLHGVWLGRWSAGCIAKLGGIDATLPLRQISA